MNAIIQQAVGNVIEPVTQKTLSDLAVIKHCHLHRGELSIEVELGFPARGIYQSLAENIHQAVSAIDGVEKVVIDVQSRIEAAPAMNQQSIAGVKNIIAVASGKGGVGKSTTSVNIALALAAEGARVGILDADIYGPSQPHLLGVGERRPQITVVDSKQMMVPIDAHGIQSISMGYLVTEQTPVMWRGPMVSGALQQLLGQTAWQNIDYLIIDMPPGTGDIQITLAQKVPVTGSLIVTTPQDLALLDAKKAIEMFQKVSVPVLGVVENMSVHVCTQCGHAEPIFGEGGGQTIADNYHADFLGALPLDLSIRLDADAGLPSVAKDPDSPISAIYREVARKLAANLWLRSKKSSTPMSIEISDD